VAKDDFATNDFLRDQAERTQQLRTDRRRTGRSQQRRLYVLGAVAMFGLLILGLPSLVSHSPLGRSLVASAAAQQGLQLTAESLRIGWFTPLRLTGIQIRSQSTGNHFRIARIDSGLTVTDMLQGIHNQLGKFSIRGVDIQCTMNEGRCSLEDDLQALLESDGSSESFPTGAISVEDISVAVMDASTGKTWKLTQSSAQLELEPSGFALTFAGLLGEPSGDAGSLQATVTWQVSPGSQRSRPKGIAPTAQWLVHLDSETLPLSVVSLVRRRFPESANSIPSQISGNTSGMLRVTGYQDGTVALVVDRLQVRHLQATDPSFGDRVWANQLGKLDGELTWTDDRLLGRNLHASTDFASARMDGSFAKSLSLTGTQDNPLQWLDAIDGSASLQIDLASFDQALPGILPLREKTRIVSGRLTASIDSAPNGPVHRSQLSLRSEPFRASASGRAVVVEPIELTAVVSRENGSLNAERFQWKSTFATIDGRGDLRSGAADFEMDFGRLASILRPLVEISETQLDGLARGNIHWNASGDNLWRLTGSAKASSLQLTLPSGQMIRQPNLSGEVNATGRWGDKQLDELTQASLKFISSGMDLRAQLTKPVKHPTSESAMPVRITGNGRLESLAEIAHAWLPPEIHDADGDFTLDLQADVSTLTKRLTSANIELTQARVGYGTRWFAQPQLKLIFDGSWAWPSGDFEAKTLTLAGEAVSAGLRGRVNAEATELEIAWRAKLERIQGSVRKRLARQSPPSSQTLLSTRPVSFRTDQVIETDAWLVMGAFDGKLSIRRSGPQFTVQSQTTGKNIAVVQPPQAAATAQTIGPMPRGNPSSSSAPRTLQQQPRVVWSEPNLKLDGTLYYNRDSGQLDAKKLQIAGDWFATTLSGGASVLPSFHTVKLNGPANFKMPEVASRLSQLAGMAIQAEGVHQTPLAIEAHLQDDGSFDFLVAGHLGWESGEVAGVRLGESTVPFRFTETSISISPSRIPVGQGSLNLAGDVYYRPGPVWLRVPPGVVARSVRLTPAMNEKWLKYLAPLAADAARIDGTFSAEIDEAMIVIDEPRSSRVRGRLNIEGVQMTAGPLTQQIIGGIDQLKALARAVPGQAPAANRDTSREMKLVTMPPQSVEFRLDQGIVSHKTIFFEIDRAQVVTSGQVSLDGELNMTAQIPLDPRWLGSNLQGLAGQGVSLPIAGTISRPRLDSSGVRQVVAQLTTRAVQSAGDGFIQKQLERGEGYIEEQLGRGLDRLFGR